MEEIRSMASGSLPTTTERCHPCHTPGSFLEDNCRSFWSTEESRDQLRKRAKKYGVATVSFNGSYIRSIRTMAALNEDTRPQFESEVDFLGIDGFVVEDKEILGKDDKPLYNYIKVKKVTSPRGEKQGKPTGRSQ